MYKKKQRGQMRKLNRLKKYLIADTTHFPIPQGKCDHWHMPCNEDFLNSSKTSPKIKKQAIQCMIDCAQHLYIIKPKEIDFCRIVCIFTIPHIWNSQLVAFFDVEYYNHFFDRKNDYQKWTEVRNPSMKQQRNLRIIPQFLEKCYLEEIDDSGETFKQYLWIYGELD